MKVTVNNDQHELADMAAVYDALMAIGITATNKGIAVAVNDEVVPRTLWEDHKLQPGDKITVIRATQGG